MTVSNNIAVITNKASAIEPAAVANTPEQIQVKIQIQTKVHLKVNQITVHLRKIPLFAHLTEEEMQKVKADLRFKQFNRRDVVLQKGGIGDSLLFLLSGQLQVVDVTEDGRAIGLRMLNEGDFFGEIAIINDSTRSASVVALSNVLVAFLPSATALHLFAHSPTVANMILRHLAGKIQRDSEFRALLSINNTSRRIYAFIDLYKKSMPGNLGGARHPEVGRKLGNFNRHLRPRTAPHLGPTLSYILFHLLMTDFNFLRGRVRKGAGCPALNIGFAAVPKLVLAIA